MYVVIGPPPAEERGRGMAGKLAELPRPRIVARRNRSNYGTVWTETTDLADG